MTRRLSPLLLPAALAALLALPALAQHSVSGTIGGRGAASAAASTPAATPAATPGIGPAAQAPASGTAGAALPPSAAASAVSSAVVDAPAPSANGAGVSPAAAPAPLALGLPPPAATPPAPSASGSLLQTTLALLLVLGLLIGLAWLLKRFGPRALSGGNSPLRLVGALNVGTRERILVVEVGEQWIVVGASPGRMNALATLPRQPLPDTGMAPATLQGANFAEWFKQTLEKRNGK